MVVYIASSLFGGATIDGGIGNCFLFFGFPVDRILPAEIAAIFIFLTVNLAGLGLSGAAERMLTVVQIVPLVVIALLLLPLVRLEHLPEMRPVASSSFVAAILVVFWPYSGLERGAMPVGDARARSATRASVLIVAFAALALYLVLNLDLIGSIGADTLATPPLLLHSRLIVSWPDERTWSA